LKIHIIIIRQNYGIGFLWFSIPVGNFNISRIQSFADEPGTFAFALIPAIFYTYFYSYKKSFYILFITLLFTLSVGILGSFLMYLILFSYKNVKYKIVFVTCILLLILPSDVTSFLFDYIASKFSEPDSGISSVGMRQEGLSMASDKLYENPFGLGLIGNTYLDVSMASSFVIGFVKGGYLGGFFYFFSFTLLLFYAIKFIRIKDVYYKMIGSIYFVFYFSSLSRGEMDITFFHMWIIGMMLYTIINYKKRVYKI
jgi:hypothetical protein